MSSTSATSHPFTCNSCQVAFRSSDLQRSHMQSDWHRYNLKRRVASLPPLSSEIFAEKVLASKADAAAAAAKASFERACEACSKTYFSGNAFNNHLGSAKHKQNVARLSRAGQAAETDARSVMSSTFSLGESQTRDATAADDDEDGEEEFDKVIEKIKSTDLKGNGADPIARRPSRPHHDASHGKDGQTGAATDITKDVSNDDPKTVAKRECLYCNNYSSDLDANVSHMAKEHGLFIPEQEYLADLEGLILFLNRKVHFHYQCTSCNRLKWSEDGIKAHMRDLGHCKIAYETEDEQLEIGKFYDFRSTYSDGEDDSESESEDEDDRVKQPSRRSKLGAKRGSIQGSDEDGEEEGGEGWETDSSASSVPSEELGRVYYDDDRGKDEKYGKLKTHRHHARSSTSHHRSADGYHSHAHKATNAVYHDEFELHLPTGRIAGHRQFNKYYRQNLRTIPTAEERQQRLLLAASSESNDDDDGRDEPARGRATNRELVSRANGGLGMLHVSDAKKREVKAMEKKQQRNEGRALRKAQWRVNKHGNHQQHFRDPLLQ